MSSHRTLRHAVTTAILAAAFLSQGTWALAGVTGNIAGIVKNQSGAPVAGVTVQAVAPSQTATVSTDAGGHFVLLGLNPDTYTLNLTKSGYQSVSYPGIVVFADQTQQETFTLQPALRTIARVTATSAASLVKPGVSGDLYSVTASQISAAGAANGGGNLNTAYSAISSVPGLVAGTFGMGWNQAVVVRGANPWFTGYEYDGIPVNRAFDNYNSSTESNLGLQQLEVYTGGGPSSIASNGVSGFINQVIKTGTYPGYGSINGGIGSNPFYHQLGMEAGGSTPDRNFSYYVGLNAYNQTYNYFNNYNGANLATPGQPFAGYAELFTTASGQGDFPVCAANDSNLATAPGCYGYLYGLAGEFQAQTDRESVVNLHMGIPHGNGLRDDVQLLWSTSALRGIAYFNPTTGVGINSFTQGLTGLPYTAGVNYPHYQDAIAYDLPFGTSVASCAVPGPSGTCASGLSYTAPGVYAQPNSVNHSFWAPLPSNYFGDLQNNDTGIVKLQYTHALTDRSYIRVFGYTFFSDWTEDGQTSGYSWALQEPFSPNYNLITHTAGGQLQYSNQLNDQNLLTFTGNYTTANVLRLNNEYFEGSAGLPAIPYGPLLSGGGPACGGSQVLTLGPAACPFVAASEIGYMHVGGPNKFTCYDPGTGAPTPCIPGGSWESNAWFGPTGYAAGKAANWVAVWSGNNNGPLNEVKPEFANLALSDEFRPSDQFLIDAAIRYDNYNYSLAPSNAESMQFAAFQVANYYCVNPSHNNTVLVAPLTPGTVPPPSALTTSGDCDALYAQKYPGGTMTTGWVHPNGTVQDGVHAPTFTNVSPPGYDQFYYSPRLAFTFTQNPDTVWRFSGGRYTEPPLSAATQYLYSSGSGATNLWANFMGDGFYSPFHPLPGMSTGQYDLSFEHHFHASPWSIKITPFYTHTSNWEQQAFIGSGFVTQVPVGQFQSEGAEMALTAGDFTRNGLSGQLSFTYTHAVAQYQNLLVPNLVDTMNQQIKQFNALTKAGGGSPCYAPFVPSVGTVTPMPCSKAIAIANPYYNMPLQGLLDPNGWYPASIYQLPPAFGPGYGIYAESYTSPYVSTLLLNWRHNRLALTPSIQFESGAKYGSPMDVAGVDPRVCQSNQTTPPSTAFHPVPDGNGQYCNYLTMSGVGATGYLFIPNPQTGSFATLGQYTQPNILAGNLQVRYDVSPRITLTATAANIFRSCFGGSSTPWSAAFPANPNYCGYATNGSVFTGVPGVYDGYYNGKTPYDTKANPGGGQIPFMYQSYAPSSSNGPSFTPLPFELFVQAQLKI
jgi:hypothetical protein